MEQEEKEKLLKNAERSMSAGSYKRAEELYAKLMDDDPNDCDAILGNAKAIGMQSSLSEPRFQEMASAYNTLVEVMDEMDPEKAKEAKAKAITVFSEVMTAKLDEAMGERTSQGSVFLSSGLHGLSHMNQGYKDDLKQKKKAYTQMLIIVHTFFLRFNEQEMVNDPVLQPAYMQLCQIHMKCLTIPCMMKAERSKEHDAVLKQVLKNKSTIVYLKDLAKHLKTYRPDLTFPGEKGNGCYVATAVYGSYDCPEVWVLRRFRDDCLAKHLLGRAFIKTYYAISPRLVLWFGNSAWFRKLWLGPLNRLVERLKSKGYGETPYRD